MEVLQYAGITSLQGNITVTTVLSSSIVGKINSSIVGKISSSICVKIVVDIFMHPFF